MAISGEGFPSRAPTVFAVTLAMIAVSTVFVFFRFVSRIFIVRKVTLDDYFMVLAWIFAFGLSFAICYGTSVGLGRHIVDVPLSWQPALLKSDYTFSVLYNPALMATKTSILVFYLQLSKNQKVFRWATIATMVVVDGAGLALTFLNIFQCTPVHAAFDLVTAASEICTNIITLYLSSAPVNILTDCAILLIPMPILTGMRLPRKQKIILVVTFGFGIFVTVVDVVRIAYLQDASKSRLANVAQGGSSDAGVNRAETDFSWYGSLSFMWSAVEVNVGIWCACVPALKPLVSRFMPHLLRDRGEMTEKQGSVDRTVAIREISLPDPVPRDQESVEPEAAPENDQMGMMDFLTTPDMTGLPLPNRKQSAVTDASKQTQPASPAFFDFVNMKKQKCMLHMTNRESLYPNAVVTVLFFLWGFAYGLSDTLNSEFQTIAHMTTGQSIGIHSAYFGGYLVGPLTFGRVVFKRGGFKACFVLGLVIYACGTLIFWPSAVLTSFPAFLVSNFIVGVGLSTLEIAANPFGTLCGPPEYGEMRLNFMQGIQAVGTIIAPLVIQKAYDASTVMDAPSLIDVQWTYLGIALFTILLAEFFFYAPLPEASDDELEEAAQRMDDANRAKIGKLPVMWISLGLGVFSQFMYVGGQESLAVWFGRYETSLNLNLDLVGQEAIAHTAFAVSRFLAVGLGFFIKPRHQLLVFFLGAILFAALSTNFHGAPPAAFIILVFFFEGPIFNFIYAIALRGQGRNTKDAAALLTAAISGGALFSAIIRIVGQHYNAQYAMVVYVAVFAAGAIFPIYLEAVPKARRQVDPVSRKPARAESSPSSPASSTDRSTKRIFNKLPWRRKSTTTEHVEERSWRSSSEHSG